MADQLDKALEAQKDGRKDDQPMASSESGASTTSLVASLVGAGLQRVAQAATGIIISLYLKFISQHGVDVTAAVVGILAAMASLWELIVAPFLGAVSDQRGRKPFLLAGPLLGAVSSFATGLTQIIGVFFITRSLEGVGAGASAPATLGFIADVTDADNLRSNVADREKAATVLRRRLTSFYEIASLVGLALGLGVGGYLWDKLHQGSFAVAAAIYVASVVAFAFVKESRRRHPNTTFSPFAFLTVFKNPAIRLFAPAWIAINAVVGLWYSNASFQFYSSTTGSKAVAGQSLVGVFSGTQVGIIFGVFGALFSLGIVFWAFAFPQARKTSIMIAALGGMFTICAVIFALNHINLSNTALVVPLMVIGSVAIVVESGFTPVALAYLADISGTVIGNRGAVMGLYSLFLGLGSIIGSGAGGFFAERSHLDGILLCTVILAAISLSAVLVLRFREKR